VSYPNHVGKRLWAAAGGYLLGLGVIEEPIKQFVRRRGWRCPKGRNPLFDV
jgi:hypothetical protein